MRRGENRIPPSNLSIYYRWKNIKSSYNNNKFKISSQTWNHKFKLPDGSYNQTKDKNGENVPHLEITVVVLVHCNITNNYYPQDSYTQEWYEI